MLFMNFIFLMFSGTHVYGYIYTYVSSQHVIIIKINNYIQKLKFLNKNYTFHWLKVIFYAIIVLGE